VPYLRTLAGLADASSLSSSSLSSSSSSSSPSSSSPGGGGSFGGIGGSDPTNPAFHSAKGLWAFELPRRSVGAPVAWDAFLRLRHIPSGR